MSIVAKTDSPKWGRLRGIPLSPTSAPLVLQKVRRGETTESALFVFTVSGVTVAPAVNDLYTNNGASFTITQIISATQIKARSTGGPSSSGTLTRSIGSGDATIAFSTFTEPQPFVATIRQPLESFCDCY